MHAFLQGDFRTSGGARARLCIQSAHAQTPFGAQGAEGEPNRRQQWLVPSPDPGIAAHALLFRPLGDGPFPLALIAHATTQNALRRAQMPQPEYRALAARLVARGFAVLVPERPGHGATGGRYLEDQGGCDEADYSRAGHATADSIEAALDYLRGQSFIRQDGAVIVGHSAGGWGALALAGENPQGVAGIIAFAPGRGGHADDFPNQVCAPQRLISSAAEFGEGARVPVTWLVAANDTYFSPDLSRQMADAFRRGGDKVDFRVLAASGGEGHWLAEADGDDKSLRRGAGCRVEDGRGEAGQEAMTSGASIPWPDDDVILYDGVCVFCSRWIRFIATRDVDRRFRFTAIQSGYGTRLAQAFGIDPARSRHQRRDPWRRRVFQIRRRADGAVESAGMGMGARLRRLPKPLRDAVYNLVARNRYRIFGKYEACFVPDAELRARVME